MCGRFTLEKPIDAIQHRFDLDLADVTEYKPRYNISPGQQILTIIEEQGVRKPRFMRWGLVPSWQKELKAGPINARLETVTERPMFRAAYRQRRCLIPADGFYEWQKVPGGKQPYRFTLADEALFAFAGLWEAWHGPDGVLHSCTLLTAEPNELIRPVHDRMPVILPQESEAAWLRAESLELGPYPAEAMTSYRVSTRVNSPRNDDPGCSTRIEDLQPQTFWDMQRP